jgi:hypothetical protein
MMNDDPQFTDEQLRLATSRSLPADCPLDAETAAARDSFLALGSAVESGARKFDEAALINRLTSTCVSLPQPPARDWWWPLIISGALAAGMLLAVARIAIERQRPNPQIAIAAPGKAASAPAIAVITPAAVTWNDPLDDEIAHAATTIERFWGPTRGVDSSLLDMNDRLEALSQELQGETL